MNARKHHDEIAASPSGQVLMVVERTPMQLRRDGQTYVAPVGMQIRVKFCFGGLWCETEINDRMETVVFDPRDFGALERVTQPV